MEYFSDNVTQLNIYSSHEKDWTKIHKFPVRVAESKAQKLHHHVSDVNVVLILFLDLHFLVSKSVPSCDHII